MHEAIHEMFLAVEESDEKDGRYRSFYVLVSVLHRLGILSQRLENMGRVKE